MSKPSVYIFNPETDYALGADTPCYTPPANVRALRRDLALHPLTLASPGDYIVLLDNDTSISESQDRAATKKGVKIIPLAEMHDFLSEHEDVQFRPWGWNRSIRALLLRHGVSPALLPSEEEIDVLRQLAHRRTTIDFYREFHNKQAVSPTTIPDISASMHDSTPETGNYFVGTQPQELTSPSEVKEVLESGQDLYFKAPWSSSGRSVIFAPGGRATESNIRQIEGIIKRQGSVMAEMGLPKALDFASLWWADYRGVDFVGLSVFGTAEGGGYKGNVYAPQKELRGRIQEVAPMFGEGTIALQKEALESIVTGRYRGPLGIDMLAQPDGRICPCIEINFRLTMGFTQELIP